MMVVVVVVVVVVETTVGTRERNLIYGFNDLEFTRVNLRRYQLRSMQVGLP